MSQATFLVGDVFQRMAELDDHSFDLIITSPPFLALRSYLPDGHPDKALEIGSEATPAEFLDTMLALTAEWRRLLAPHGSIAIEIGDTYAGSGGAGGDYNEDGLREGQARFDGSARRTRPVKASPDAQSHRNMGEGTVAITGGAGWPLDKSLCGIPTLYTWSLAYGRNLLTGQPSPAGQWRIRNLKPWIRSNPPVGALGDKERPATSYITVATLARDRWFDLDSVRTAYAPTTVQNKLRGKSSNPNGPSANHYGGRLPESYLTHAGAPPLDWVHTIDLILDTELNARARDAGKESLSGSGQKREAKTDGGWSTLPPTTKPLQGATGKHLRRALQNAGVIPPHPDALDVSPKGYAGAHYAVWPPELVRQLVDEMCPRRVCRECGEPSRRIVEVERLGSQANTAGRNGRMVAEVGAPRNTVGWSDCGHDNWRPGRILDPFVGSGTTLAVATGMARTATGIDLDPRNADLARDRVGMFLTVHEREAPDAI